MVQRPTGTTVWNQAVQPGLRPASAPVVDGSCDWLNPLGGDLDPTARAVFDAVIAVMPTGHFQIGDGVLLAAFARAAAVERKIAKATLSDPNTITTSEREAYADAVRAL